MIVFRHRQSEFRLGDEEADAYTAKHTKRLIDTRKSIKTVHANLLAGSLEDLPFGVLGLVYAIVPQSCNQLTQTLFEWQIPFQDGGYRRRQIQPPADAQCGLELFDAWYALVSFPLVPASALLAACRWPVIRCETVKAPSAEEPDGLRVKAGVRVACLLVCASIHLRNFF